MKILIIEDDKNILSFLKRGFEEDGYIIDSAIDGVDGEYLALINQYDVIILDWMLPNKSGIEILKSLKLKGITTPIIMLTAKNMLKDKINGIKTGADDYLTKPFEYEELLVRVEALYRRSVNSGSSIIKLKNLTIDIDNKIVKKDDELLKLTRKEYELLSFFIKNRNAVISKEMIEEQLWNNETFINSNVISVTMHHLRAKIGKDMISSNRGLGYKLEI
ncbi:DNA-binding response regulator [hydrothermal vent metagenome]|uniref:DNA-binding response regulator n=1 Tax=hydrothermal vent metagenome TaxID=652676 RepID=A0A1W1CSE4_9ZZZZ